MKYYYSDFGYIIKFLSFNYIFLLNVGKTHEEYCITLLNLWSKKNFKGFRTQNYLQIVLILTNTIKFLTPDIHKNVWELMLNFFKKIKLVTI